MGVTKNQILAYTTNEETIVGNGNGKLHFKAATANLGNRTALTADFPVQTTSGSPQASKTVKATLVAMPEFVEFDSETQTAQAAGGNITITGKSNSKSLEFTLGNGDLEITLPAQFNVAGSAVNNGDAIANDPGAKAKYNFSIQITVPENTGVTEITKVLNVAAEGGQTATTTIRQAAGAPELEVSELTISVPQDGTVVSLDVTSNTTWTIVQ